MPRDPLAELFDAFLRFEEEQSMWSASAQGYEYWQAVRIGAFDAVASALGLVARRQTYKPYRYVRPLVSRPRFIGTTLRRYLIPRRATVDVLVLGHSRYQSFEGQWMCPYTAPLLKDFPFEHLTLVRSDKGFHFHPDAAPETRYLDGVYALANVDYFVRNGTSGGLLLSRHERHSVTDWVGSLGRQMNVSLDLPALLRRVRSAVRHGIAYGRASARLLDDLKPRVAVIVEHYSDRCLAFTREAKQRGVLVAELQHGTIGGSHPAYNVSEGRRPPSFPDYVLTFGELWRTMMPRIPLDAAHTPAIGFAWLEMHLERVRRKADRRTIVFVSQSTIGEPLSRLAAEAAAELGAAGWHVLYKLHPGEVPRWRERMPWLERAGIEVVDRPVSIYEVFAGAGAQVGVYSTALYEGVAFGLRTFVAELPGCELAEPLIQAGVARRIATASELVAALRDAEPGREAFEGLGESVWRPNARQNFIELTRGWLG